MLHCRVCGFDGDGFETYTAGSYFRCQGCGSIILVKLPSTEELRTFYGSFNDTYTAGMAERFDVEMPKRHAGKLRLVQRYARSGTLLDVGCGEGWFIELANHAGYQAEGCDFGLRSSYPEGVKVKTGQLDAVGGLPYPDASFDIVTFWAVIEHVRDPAAALAEIRRVLKPGGVMFCETPIVGDFCERMAPQAPPWLGAPEHINIFSREALSKMVGGAGLRPVRHYAFYERNAPRWWMRRLRNFALAGLKGAALRMARPRAWRHLRQTKQLHMGDVQLVVARR